MSKRNFPQQVVTEMCENNPDFVKNTVDYLTKLRPKGKPKNAEELQAKIDDYFKFCSDTGFRPAIESLCLCLGVSRTTFWQWRNGSRGNDIQEVCASAVQLIITFLEACVMSGKINPASGIFLLKNVAGYSDSTTLEIKKDDPLHDVELSIQDIASRIPIEDVKRIERRSVDATDNTNESN